MDTDSFVFEIETDDFCNIAKDVEKAFIKG